MNFEYFISKRLVTKSDYKSSISAPIIKIAISAIAIGVVMMFIAVATGFGLQEKIREKIAAFNGHIVINNFTNNQATITQNPVSTQQEFYPSFTSIPEIEHIQKVATKYGIIRTETDFEGIVVKGVDEQYRWEYLEEFLVDGVLPVFDESISREVLISDYLATRLGFKTGDKLIVYFLREDQDRLPRSVGLTISGIFDSGFKEFDETYIIADLKQIQRLNDWSANEIGQFELFVEDFNDIQEVGYKVYEEVDSFLNASTIVELYPSIFEWLKMFDFNIILIIGIMILVAGINMMTALLVLILERTQMIGILKALGSSDWSIRKIFLYNAGYLIFKGLFWGNLIGISLLLIQKYFKIIQLNPETYYVSEAPIYLSLDYILMINFGTLVLCLLMLLIPSVIIVKISPVKAMKFE
ncbi:lipoprotein release ABC transporter, permease protein LolE [Psychroflexus torquis ATCC 700755]|uniref:Lipoprotein release ABC transporter, permease protein LolE n=1 Tax=Psychroflexus torquis (strain ATCC 700755 / CIP 106069 / ACAM 623) TaxID=313595 RepID=K4IAN7_PSYTT|nr:FtsX-like permease family protein [Psychroflexus torquis]AFU67682.1 lipoprotein release ABC transporter, permease protein LolE [Psychroflexus torquis ATCC 700755]